MVVRTDNQIKTEGVAIICKSLKKNTSLTHLDLEGEKIQIKGGRERELKKMK